MEGLSEFPWWLLGMYLTILSARATILCYTTVGLSHPGSDFVTLTNLSRCRLLLPSQLRLSHSGLSSSVFTGILKTGES